MPKLKALLMSDTHGTHWHQNYYVEGDFDLLIYAGDFTNYGDQQEVAGFMFWLEQQDQFKDIVYIAGNHDMQYHAKPLVVLESGVRLHYLYNSSVTIDGVKFYGSPYTPRFFNWAFMYDPENAADIWSTIPNDTDVLITHGPPRGIFDQCPGEHKVMEHAGCPALLEAVERTESIKLHVFGHIHEGYGMQQHANGRVSVNAALVYRGLRREPIEFTIET